MSRRLVAVYKGSRKPEAYLYVDKARGLMSPRYCSPSSVKPSQ
jgi:uncharacterized protein YcgL (UPF0745 family)